jgi:phage-related tail protein
MSFLEQFKDVAARQVGKVLASDATLKVLSSPQVKNAMVAAINLRAEARDAVELGVKQVARQLDLVTRDDVAKLKRSMRDLQHEVEDLREQLAAQSDAATPEPANAPAAKPSARKSAARGAHRS